MAEPIAVIGGSVAGLVAADALASSGRPVRLILPARGVGGGFLPMIVGEHALELGPRLIELAYDDDVLAAPPLRDYRPGPHGHRPYLRLVHDLVSELAGADLVEATRPQLVRNGVRVLDFLLCGDLIDLPRVVTEVERAAIAAESAAAVERGGAAGMLAPEREGALWATSLAQASATNHGPTFHALFIEAIAAKVVPGGSADVLAALRRKIWLPLFHPATLRDAATGQLTYRPQRPLHTVVPGGMGALVKGLLGRARANGAIVEERGGLTRLAPAAAGNVEVGYADGTGEQLSHPVIAGSADEVFKAVGIEAVVARSRTVVAWIGVPDDQLDAPPSTLFVPDVANPLYRVSQSMASTSPGVVVLTCELRCDTAADKAGATALRALCDIGLLDAPTGDVLHAVAVDSFVAPSAANDAALRGAVDALAAQELSVEIIGGASGSGADSFNEQVVQGLAAAERL
ncbi:MAG: hypothetical protein QOE63_2063, partial [Acidimicrobiaceae bacterium]